MSVILTPPVLPRLPSNPRPPPLLTIHSSIPHGTVIIHTNTPTPISSGHKRLPRPLRSILYVFSQNNMALLVYKADKSNADEQSETKQDDIHGNRVVVECSVGQGVEAGLREVQQPGETDDETVDLAKSGEAKNFGGVITATVLACMGGKWRCIRLTIRRYSKEGGR